eukprot:Hpha_TRINITY_DN11784_c0_g1::TRINITY_DN11784_c0_g1_i1::g.32013::m.32013
MQSWEAGEEVGGAYRDVEAWSESRGSAGGARPRFSRDPPGPGQGRRSDDAWQVVRRSDPKDPLQGVRRRSGQSFGEDTLRRPDDVDRIPRSGRQSSDGLGRYEEELLHRLGRRPETRDSVERGSDDGRRGDEDPLQGLARRLEDRGGRRSDARDPLQSLGRRSDDGMGGRFDDDRGLGRRSDDGMGGLGRRSDDGASVSESASRYSGQRFGRPRAELENLVEMLRQDSADAQSTIRVLREQNVELKAERARAALSGPASFSGDTKDHQIRQLEDRLRESHRMNEALQEDCDQLELTLERLRAGERSTQDEVEQARGEALRSRRVVREQEEELRVVRAQLDSKRATVKELEAALQMREDDLTQVGNKSKLHVAEREDRIMQRDVRIKTLEDQLERSEAAKKEAADAVQLMKQFLQEKDTTIDLLKNRCLEDGQRNALVLRQQAAHQEGDFQLLERRCEVHEVEKENLNYEIECLRRALGQMKDHRQRERDEMKAITAKEVTTTRDDLQRRLDEQELELGRLQQERDFVTSERERELGRRDTEWEGRISDERKQHAEQVAELEEQLARAQASAEEVAESSKQRFDELQRRLREKDDAIGGAAAQVREAEEIFEERERMCAEASRRVEDAQGREREAEAAREEMLEQLREIAAELDTVRSQRDKLSRDLNQAQAGEQQEHSAVQERDEAIEELTRELDVRETKVSQIEDELDALRLTVRDRDAELMRYKQELDQSLAIGEELQKTADLVQTTNRRREEALKDKELDFRKQGDRLKTQEQMLQDLRHRNSFLEEEVADRDAQIRQLESMLDEQQRVADEERQSLWERERQQREDASKCQGDVRAAARSKAEMQEEVDRAREEARKAERVAQDVTAALKERDEESSELRQRVQGLLARLDDAEDKMHRERREAKTSKQGLSQLQQQVREAEERAEESAARRDELRNANETLMSDQQECADTLRAVLAERLLRADEQESLPVSSMELWKLTREIDRRVRPIDKAPVTSEVVTTTKLWLEQLPPDVARVVDAEGDDLEDDDDDSPEGHRWRETRRRMNSAVSLLTSVPELRERVDDLEQELETTRSVMESWRAGQGQGAQRRSVTERGPPPEGPKKRATSRKPSDTTASRRSTSGKVPAGSSSGPAASSSRRRR